MFGYVIANQQELTKEQRHRYNAVYCGICRSIRRQSSQLSRVGLQYDMAFLALLLMSLYEPEEKEGNGACLMHPLSRRGWVDNAAVAYAADMNVALAYCKCLDDWKDEKKQGARLLSRAMEPHWQRICREYPRQCGVLQSSLEKLSRLEEEKCPDPDACAGAFGELMAELFVWRQDLWEEDLRQMGDALGRFIYLMDAVMDYHRDARKNAYNPLLAMGTGENRQRWEEYLLLTMGRCTRFYEKLPLVQDKALLDNILYSGVWVQYRGNHREGTKNDG